jgi:hypothetical protein
MEDEMAVVPQDPNGLSDAERAELERLRAEVKLRESAQGPTVEPETAKIRRTAGWWRNVVAVVCIVLGGILVPLSVASVWAKAEVTDTNRYVDTITPLASDPGVQAAATAQISTQVFRYVDVQGLADQAFSQLGSKGVLPQVLIDQLKALETPLVNGIKGFITTQIGKFVASHAFQTAWIEANRTAHGQLVAVLSGNGPSSLSITNGKVSVNLAAVINAVKAQLVAGGFGLAANIPNVNATFTIFSDPNISKVQTGYRLLNSLGIWLPLLALILFALGIYLAGNHRRAFIWAGLTVFVSAGLLAIALALGRSAYLNAVSGDVLPRDAAASIFDTVVRFLRDGIRNMAIIGLVVAAGAFLVGPSVTATRTRELCVLGITATRTGVERLGLHLARVSEWLAPRARLLRVLSAVAVCLIFAIWPYRTPGVAIWLTVLLLVALFVIEFLATTARSSIESGDAGRATSGI